MKVDDCFQLGEIVRTHGLKGEVSIRLDVDDPMAYEELESVFLLQGGQLVPFFLEYIQVQGENALVKFEDVNGVDTAGELTGLPLYLPLSELPKLADDQYYFHELIGFECLHQGKKIGVVDGIFPDMANPLFSFKMGENEILVPLQDAFMKKVDKKARTIELDFPDGYLDIYLNP
jgi:16S rRNA processing protein RimM